MKKRNLINQVEDRHRVYVEMFCKLMDQKLIRIIPQSMDFDDVHYAFSEYITEGTYDIRWIFATLEEL